MRLDSLGVPYRTGAFEWVRGAGVQLSSFVPPATFEMPERVYDRSGDFQSGAVAHYGYELSHHAQQLLALKYLHDNAGFDPVVWCEVQFSDGVGQVALETTTGLWKEV